MLAERSNVFTRIADSLIAFVLVVCVVIWVDERQLHFGSIADFLQMRLTVSNVCFAVAFTFLWAECFTNIDRAIQRCRGFLHRAALVAGGCALMTALVALYLIVRHSPAPALRILQYFFTGALTCQMLRLIATATGWIRHEGAPQRVIILGSGRRASMAWRELRVTSGNSFTLLGFVDDRSTDLMAPDIAGRHLCGTRELPNYLLHNAIDQMVVATPLRTQYDMTQRAISAAENAGVRVICLTDLFTLRHGRSLTERASLFTILGPRDEQRRLANGVKRAIDIVGATLGLVALSPFFLVIAVAVKSASRGPVFFTQERYGYQRRRFRMWKFRSMVADAPQLMAQLEVQNEADGPIFKIKNDPRVTSVGRVLRSLSLDELPQLWNVLRGDMSLVGPRPMSIRDVSLFSDSVLMRRFSVKPGITGLWQVSGRSSLAFDKWIALDFRYIDEWSLGLDLRILARTVPVVLKRSGAA
jgi:exopolysaccharide biosynthesis polyprenyl glycosylphosphotransferase